MLDHVLAVTFAIGFPLLNVPLYARRRPLLRAGDVSTRRREYQETVLWLGGMGLATVLLWVVTGRDFAALGLALPGAWPYLVGIGVAMAVGALLFLQVLSVKRDADARKAAQQALEPVREYLPTTRDEVRWFRAVSISAGVGEELFYRGFLLWYLVQFMPLPWAIVASSILFGAAHIMHGTKAAVRATMTGAVLALLFVLSGGLWASMILHTAIDLSSGEMGLAAYGSEPDQA